ncbi:MAG TPA: class I SAM-dependent methyltransferase [Anaerolineales bacterium]|nr:class I SAM-dependent methyltransferase [Anaerolineales bacterium]
MENEAAKGLEGAERTLLLPLWARAKEINRSHPQMRDPLAVEIVNALCGKPEYKEIFADLEKGLDNFYQLSQVIRAQCLDEEIRMYLQAHPQATVVNIGAGLDTTFSRIDNGRLSRWYDLDLPEVIALRQKFIPEKERCTCIPKSVLDTTWFDDIGDTKNGLMCVACGVLFFLSEAHIKSLLVSMAGRFPGSEIAFDTMSALFMNIGNRTVLRKGGMGGQARMQWPIQSAGTLKKWSNRISVVDEYPMYSRCLFDPSWGRAAISRMKLINRLHGMNIFHLAFREE